LRIQARSKTDVDGDWIRKLDDFLRLNERQVLADAGKVSAKLAEETAAREFEKFQKKQAILIRQSIRFEKRLRDQGTKPEKEPSK